MTVFPALALLRHWQVSGPGSDLQIDLLAVTERFVNDREWKVKSCRFIRYAPLPY